MIGCKHTWYRTMHKKTTKKREMYQNANAVYQVCFTTCAVLENCKRSKKRTTGTAVQGI